MTHNCTMLVYSGLHNLCTLPRQWLHLPLGQDAVKVYLTIHNFYFENYMDKCTIFVETVSISDIQNEYTADYVTKLNNIFPSAPAEDTDEYGEYNEMTLNIRKKRDDIMSFSQTLNYMLVHSTKPGSETYSIVRQVMKQSNGFEAWRQLTLRYAGGHRAQQFSFLCTIMQASWDLTTKQFTWQHYKWLETISRYESESGQ
eukprot:1269926-Amphidinium_carterae.1